jgi:hypothetical protein
LLLSTAQLPNMVYRIDPTDPCIQFTDAGRAMRPEASLGASIAAVVVPGVVGSARSSLADLGVTRIALASFVWQAVMGC